MKTWIRNLALLLLPFAWMVLTNEAVRKGVAGGPHVRQGVAAIHPSEGFRDRCSWHCHDDTAYCKRYHTKTGLGHSPAMDRLYFGVIRWLKSTDQYRWANILVFVVFFPGLLYGLLVRSIHLQTEISKLKNR